MVEAGLPPVAAVAITIVMCIGIGATSAFFITRVKIPALITTLGMMTILRGISYVLSDGRHIWGFPESFDVLGQGNVGPIPVPVIILAFIFSLAGSS
jgi:ribose transport system permease protein